MKKTVYVQFTNPANYPPLQRSAAILAGRGWQVLFFGLQDSTGFSLTPRAGIQERRFGVRATGSKQVIQYAFFCVNAVATCLLQRAEWVYASDPFSAPVAYFLKKCFGKRVVYHEHDSPSEAGGSSFLMRIALVFRSAVARCADVCVLPNAERTEIFRKRTGAKRVETVLNCPLLEEAGGDRPNVPAQPLWVLYHGSITPERLPLTVIDAIALLGGNARLRVAGYEAAEGAGHVSRLRRRAQELGVAPWVEFLGSVPSHERLFEWGSRSHIGLALMPKNATDVNMAHMAGASNKAFEYAAYGMAFLVSNLPEWNEMYVKSGCALACDPEDPADIAKKIRRFLDDPALCRRLGETGRSKVRSEWNYEKQFERIAARMDGEIKQ